jgi:hypothetical protein
VAVLDVVPREIGATTPRLFENCPDGMALKFQIHEAAVLDDPLVNRSLDNVVMVPVNPEVPHVV